jgi:flavin-dependent dehydrogenase
MNSPSYDVAIVGAGIAGVSCALLAADRGLRVVMIEKQKRAAQPVRPDWMSARSLALLADKKIDAKPVVGEPFEGATFHSADLSKNADTTESEPPAYRVDYTRLVKHVSRDVRSKGVTLLHGAEPETIECGETSVRLTWADRKPIEAGFLVQANGSQPTPTWAVGESGGWVAELHLTGLEGPSPYPQLHWILGLDEGQTVASWWWDDALTVIRSTGLGSPDAVRQRLVGCVTQAMERRWLRGRVKITPENITVRPAPARHALEMDSHVGKRSLRIGDAGGFVSMATREGIEPAILSAFLAAETLAEAVENRTPQDVLQKFDVAWRTGMAEDLGSPGAQVPFMLPLIFKNSQMAQPLAATFWYGRQP